MGRYAGDVYFAGGAYYFSTLAAAEFCYRAALTSPATESLVERGDAFLETVRCFTPPGGDLSEQFDQQTGVQRSAPQLAWSYAAFITCAAARRQVIQRGE
jgi:glucoamylase